MPGGSLQHTVAVHNEHAARGEDPLFHKAAEYLAPLVHPPFAALDYTTRNSLYTVFTLGGLHTLPTGEVLTPDGEVVPIRDGVGSTVDDPFREAIASQQSWVREFVGESDDNEALTVTLSNA